jgi:hypothetical protein
MKIEYSRTLKFPKIKQKLDAAGCTNFGESYCKKWLKTFYPKMTYAEHKQLRDHFHAGYTLAERQYGKAVNAAFMKKFGRKPTILDYKVSGIYSDALDTADKDKIRAILCQSNEALKLAYLHNSMLLAKDKVKRGEW